MACRMVQRGEDVGFLLEPSETIRISGKCFRQDLQCDLSPELRIGGLIDLAHAPSPMRAVTS